MKNKIFSHDIDINLYVLSSVCLCMQSLHYPKEIEEEIIKLDNKIQDILFPIPKKYYDYDIKEQKFICKTIFKKFIPKSKQKLKGENNADI